MSERSRRAQINISNYCLIEALGFPSATEVIGIQQDCEGMQLFVSHPSFPEVLPNECSPRINPVFTRHQSLVEMVDWGFPKVKENFCQKIMKAEFYCQAEDKTLCKGYKKSTCLGYCEHWASQGICENEEMQKR